MFEHPEFTVKETLYEGDVSTIYRCERVKDHLPVIIKTLSAEYPGPKELARLQHEYELIKEFDIPEVIRAHDLKEYHHRFFLVRCQNLLS